MDAIRHLSASGVGGGRDRLEPKPAARFRLRGAGHARSPRRLASGTGRRASRAAHGRRVGAARPALREPVGRRVGAPGLRALRLRLRSQAAGRGGASVGRRRAVHRRRDGRRPRDGGPGAVLSGARGRRSLRPRALRRSRPVRSPGRWSPALRRRGGAGPSGSLGLKLGRGLRCRPLAGTRACARGPGGYPERPVGAAPERTVSGGRPVCQHGQCGHLCGEPGDPHHDPRQPDPRRGTRHGTRLRWARGGLGRTGCAAP